MGEPWKHDVKWKMLNTRSHSAGFPLYDGSRIWKPIDTGSWSGLWGAGEGGWWWWLRGMGLLLGADENVQKWTVVMAAQLSEHTWYTGLCTLTGPIVWYVNFVSIKLFFKKVLEQGRNHEWGTVEASGHLGSAGWAAGGLAVMQSTRWRLLQSKEVAWARAQKGPEREDSTWWMSENCKEIGWIWERQFRVRPGRWSLDPGCTGSNACSALF